MENLFIISIIGFILAYILDLNSALLLKKKKPLTFNNSESNIFFKKAINNFGNIQGSLIYTVTYQLQIMIMTIISFIVAGTLILNIPYLTIFNFYFLYFIILHLLGTLTNIISLITKKEENLKKLKGDIL